MRHLLRNYLPFTISAFLVLAALIVIYYVRSAKDSISERRARESGSSSTVDRPPPARSSSANTTKSNESGADTGPSSGHQGKEAGQYSLGWKRKATQARDNWGKLLSLKKRNLEHDQAMSEVTRIMSLADDKAKADALQNLLYGQAINLQLAQELLGIYDQQQPGDLRDVLFACMLFSSEPSYVSEQLLQRAYGQSADERQYQFLGLLPEKQDEIWRLLCDSTPQCTTEESAREATLAVSAMVESYGIEAGHRDFARHMYDLVQQTRWPSARKYLYHAMTRHPAPAIYEYFDKAANEETDEELKKYANEVLRLYFKKK